VPGVDDGKGNKKFSQEQHRDKAKKAMVAWFRKR